MITLYNIKPRFQDLLRPLVQHLYKAGVSANQVTLAAATGSIIVGAILVVYVRTPSAFLILPIWMFMRMSLNAVDGMLAREFNQQSTLGTYLNELCDVVSDAALFLPFAFIAPFDLATVLVIIFLATLSEFTGVLALSTGASRRYDGPMGKSDRAFVFGALGLWVGIATSLPGWIYWLLPFVAALTTLTIINRIKYGLIEKGEQQ